MYCSCYPSHHKRTLFHTYKRRGTSTTNIRSVWHKATKYLKIIANHSSEGEIPLRWVYLIILRSSVGDTFVTTFRRNMLYSRNPLLIYSFAFPVRGCFRFWSKRANHLVGEVFKLVLPKYKLYSTLHSECRRVDLNIPLNKFLFLHRVWLVHSLSEVQTIHPQKTFSYTRPVSTSLCKLINIHRTPTEHAIS